MVEEALRSNIKRSMQELSRAINGDSKTSPNPLFGVLVILHQGAPQTSAKVTQHYFIELASGSEIYSILNKCNKVQYMLFPLTKL